MALGGAPGASWAQGPGGLGLNPDYPAPDARTRPGVGVTSAALVENADAWNGRVVSFTGEAIGERMVRGAWAWIHLNDDAYMWRSIEEGANFGGYNSGHSVWLAAGLARTVGTFGDYKHAGDVVRVVGEFHAACPEHGGDMDIHATRLEVVRSGRPVTHVVDRSRVWVGSCLWSLAGVFYWLRRIAERRRV